MRAGGYSILLEAGTGGGVAGATGASGDDPSAMLYNPAAVGRLTGRRFYCGGAAFYAKEALRLDSGSRVEADNGVVVPPFVIYTHRLSSLFAAGLAIGTPFGLRRHWRGDELSTRGFADQVDIKGFTATPVIALASRRFIHVGVGADIRVLRLKYRSPLPNNGQPAEVSSGSHTLIAPTAGVVLRPAGSRLSLGLSFRGPAHGDLALTYAVPSSPDDVRPLEGRVELPPSWSFAVAYLGRPWVVEVAVRRELWSQRSLVVPSVDDPSVPSPSLRFENWRDSTDVVAGATKALKGGHRAFAGVSWFQAAVPSNALTPTGFDVSQVSLHLGGAWVTGRISFQSTLRLSLFGDRQSTNPDLPGTFNRRSGSLSVGLSYEF